MVVLAQLVRALDCGSRGRRFEPGIPPLFQPFRKLKGFFMLSINTQIQYKPIHHKLNIYTWSNNVKCFSVEVNISNTLFKG